MLGEVGEFGMDTLYMCPLLYLEWITNKDLLYSTGDPAQSYVTAWMGAESGENGHMNVCG